MNKETYSNIVSSIQTLNKEIQIQDIRTVKMFSYMYNQFTQLKEDISKNPTNEDIKFISYCIVNLDQRFQKNEIKIGKLEKKIDKIISFINTIPTDNQIIHEDKKTNWFIKCCNCIGNFFKSIYNYFIDLINKRKLRKQQEEENRLKEEEEKKKLEIRNNRIKKILNNSNK